FRTFSNAGISASLFGFVCLYGRSVCTEFERLAPRVFELGAGVGCDEVAGLDLLEAVALQDLRVLCFQQSAGNSACPEVDVALALLAHRLLDRDVGELESAARAEHT